MVAGVKKKRSGAKMIKVSKNSLKFLAGFFLAFLILPLFGLADEAKDQQTLELQAELKKIEEEIALYESQLSQVKSEKNTLNKKISELKLQQKKINAQIQQTNLSIKKIEGNLEILENDLALKEQKVAETRTQIAELIRSINKKDRYSLLAVLMSNEGIGGFFNQLSAYRKLTDSLDQTVVKIQAEMMSLVKTQGELSEQQEEQENFVAIKTLQNQELSGNLAERNNLLNQTKSKESNYQAIISDKQKKAAEINGRIYDLLGIARAVTFGEALKIAEWASSQTGVRPAFLLAILTQESNLGRNVGTCNRPGDGPEKSWKVIMKPERDQEPFKTITAELGMNPDVTPVSCPMKDSKGNQIGWGGAMGPAQFIPSTWMGYRGKVSAITGKFANPWDIRDAFLASAIKLKADGAGAKAGEWTAAMKYFSGSTNSKYRFYADNVAAIADKYEQDIADLKAGNGS